VGEKWNSKEYFLPDVMVAADAMKTAIEYLKPHMAAGGGGSAGTVVIGTVKGDIHSIGKNLVALFMELAGFEVHNLGEDVSAERYVEAAVKHQADIVGSSAFVSTVAGEIVRIEEGLKAAGVRDNIFTMVGGAVFDPQWAEKVGADAYGRDAMQAVELAKAFMAKKKARA
jgi:methanogenic corrinoid protein MtbC1